MCVNGWGGTCLQMYSHCMQTLSLTNTQGRQKLFMEVKCNLSLHKSVTEHVLGPGYCH